MITGIFKHTLVLATNHSNISNTRINSDISLNTGDSEIANKREYLNTILYKYREAITCISGIGMIFFVTFFIYNFIFLGIAKPQEIQRARTRLMISSIATTALGSTILIITLLYLPNAN